MLPSPDTASPVASRRGVLAGLAGGLAATAGCIDRARTVAGRQRPEPVTISIKTVPTDDDPYALLVGRKLSEWFQTAGLDAHVQPMAGEELLRQVLVNNEFDLFVGRFPDRALDPDSLYTLMHSRFGAEPGWQNPFGYANLAVDDLLERQRTTTGRTREDAVVELQRTLARENPFTVLAFPDVVRAARTDRYDGFVATDVASPFGIVRLHRTDSEADELRMTTTDEQLTTTLNPLLASQRRVSAITDLVYDPLARRYQGTSIPWSATDWTWDDGTFEASLRPDLSFHDGVPVTATDVAFTYQFLRDTSFGEGDQVAPTMDDRGRSTLVEAASVLDDRTVRLEFGDRTQAVAQRALTVPILPRHVWDERTQAATIAGLDLGDGSTEALVTNNVPPVGSGPLAFASASRNERLVLERFDGHFLNRAAEPDIVDDVPDAVAEGVAFDQLVLRHVGSDSSAVDMVDSGDADCTLAGLGPGVVRRIGRSNELDLLVDQSSAFYFAGVNTRRAPFGNPRFRQLLARLVDRANLSRTVFSTFATPAVTPLAGTEWASESVSWEGRAPAAPFIGEGGEVDAERARAAFRQAGYQYDDRDRLLGT